MKFHSQSRYHKFSLSVLFGEEVFLKRYLLQPDLADCKEVETCPVRYERPLDL